MYNSRNLHGEGGGRDEKINEVSQIVGYTVYMIARQKCGRVRVNTSVLMYNSRNLHGEGGGRDEKINEVSQIVGYTVYMIAHRRK